MNVTTAGQPFVDYYSVLRVDPSCDTKTLEAAYHSLLKACHPDHTGTPDTTKLSRVVEAYRVLRSPDRRTEYDALHAQFDVKDRATCTANNEDELGESTALDDADAHARILTHLYKKRREDAQNAGVAGFYIQQLLKCSDENFEFHKWYLKEKGFIVITEHGTLAITIQGIDHVIATSRSTRVAKLLIAQSESP